MDDVKLAMSELAAMYIKYIPHLSFSFLVQISQMFLFERECYSVSVTWSW